MRHAVLSLVLGSCLVVMGSEPADSLHPLIPPGEAIFNSSLQADWILVTEGKSDESVVLTFFRIDPSNLQFRDYSVRLTAGKEAVELLGRLGRIDEQLYLDLSPAVELWGTGVHFLQGIYAGPAFEQRDQVVKLNGQLLLEARAENKDGEGNEDIRQLRIKVSPIHWIFKVELTDKELRLGFLDDDYLSKLIEDETLNIDCVQEGGLILTAMTSQLQQLVVQVVHDPDAFSWIEFEKVENQ